jgi:Domain of unknown function (DUF4399)
MNVSYLILALSAPLLASCAQRLPGVGSNSPTTVATTETVKAAPPAMSTATAPAPAATTQSAPRPMSVATASNPIPAATKAVYFIEPQDGATVPSEFKVVMGLKGMTLKPAGDMTPETGHHHLIIDNPPLISGEAIPATDKYIHFGKGQTDTMVKLAPGKHMLVLQFGNGLHQSYGPAMSSIITVNVK